MQKNVPLGKTLIDAGLISEDKLLEALDEQKKTKNKRLGEVLIELGFVSEKDILTALSNKMNLPFVENPIFQVDFDAFNLVPEDLQKKARVLPLYIKDGVLVVAMSDPLDFYTIEDIRMLTGLHVKAVISSKHEIEKAQIKIANKKSTSETLTSINEEYSNKKAMQEDESEMIERIDSAPIVKLFNNIVVSSMQANASDIHIEPGEDETKVRLRVDGELRESMSLQNSVHPLLSTRIKILSGMNIAEKRIPQDGRFKFMNNLEEIDMRVSSIPTIYGEKIVLRLLGRNADVNYKLEDMGFSAATRDTLKDLLKFSNGIILATGPTGSGKTTTLYAMLNEVINPKLNIVTVEDPVEKRIDGVNQVQVNTKAGLTFASGLRSILRQDPDIIMIGEIRDGETAEIAIRAAITGHLVISTLHTNDSFGSIARLIDMGVEPYLLVDSIRGVIAQRLVKRVCTNCKKEVDVTVEQSEILGPSLKHSFIGTGCEFCAGTGYRGRIAVNEIFKMDKGIKQLIINNSSDVEAIRNYAIKNGIRTIKDDLMELVNEGITSVSEAIKIVYSIE